MARARNIKPGFFTNPELVELSFETRLLFAGLWTVADRQGRLEDRPKKIKMEVFPADAVDIDMMLSELCKAGFLIRYEVQGAKYIQIKSWMKHQTPHHTEKASVIPAPEGHMDTEAKRLDNGDLTVNTPKQDGGNPPDSLIHRFTDSPIPDPLQEKPSVEPCTDKSVAPQARGSRIPQDWFLPKAWGDWAVAEFGWTAEIVRSEADKFKDHWLSESGAKARKVDWLATWRKWCRSDIAQRAHQSVDGPKSSAHAALPWFETGPGIRAMGKELGCGDWDECEQFPTYRNRVFDAAKKAGKPLPQPMEVD